jgi:MoaA/NifB/PqqE/SkfB family radical SAM enzyme
MRNISDYKHSFDFSITSFCQAKCRSCVRTDPDSGDTASWLVPEHMSIENFRLILSNSPHVMKNSTEIRFCGELGDPMMHPNITEFVETALENVTDRVIINTNGGLRQPKWYEYAANRFGDRLFIEWGIDGFDQDTNNLYREAVDWQRAMDNMTTWFTNHGSGQWEFLIFDWNWHQIPEVIEYANKINCSIYLKFNNRSYGLISDENKKMAIKLLEEYNVL